MSKIPVYICNHKRCMVCYRTLCGRTVDKEFAELDENGDPIIAEYYDDEEVTYWEAAYILEHGSTDYGKIQEAGAIALKVIKELIKKLDEAEDVKFRERPVKGPLYGTRSNALFIDELCGEEMK